MTSATIFLYGQREKAKAKCWIDAAPPKTRVDLRTSKRSIPQNSRLWAMLTDIATQQLYHGMKLTPDDWKLLFMDALSKEVRAVPSLDGTSFVNIGNSSSRLTKEQMTDLIDIIHEWGARNGVVFHAEKPASRPEEIAQ